MIFRLQSYIHYIPILLHQYLDQQFTIRGSRGARPKRYNTVVNSQQQVGTTAKSYIFSSIYSIVNKMLCREERRKGREAKSGKNALCRSCAMKFTLSISCSIIRHIRIHQQVYASYALCHYTYNQEWLQVELLCLSEVPLNTKLKDIVNLVRVQFEDKINYQVVLLTCITLVIDSLETHQKSFQQLPVFLFAIQATNLDTYTNFMLI